MNTPKYFQYMKDMFSYAGDNDHEFHFARNTPSSSFEYASCSSYEEFEMYYNSIPKNNIFHREYSHFFLFND